MASVRDICGGRASRCGNRVLCQNCDLELEDWSAAKRHFQEDHDHWRACYDADEDGFVCIPCGMCISSRNRFDQHVAGWGHSKRMDWLYGDGQTSFDLASSGGDSVDDSHSDSEASWHETEHDGCSSNDCSMPPGHMLCKLCDISCDREAMWNHLHSAAHREVAMGDWGAQIACIECGVLCGRQHALEQHLLGARHRARVRWLHNPDPTEVPAGLLNAKLFKELEALLTCPISHAIMRDPVVTQDGHSYERSAIEQWYRNNSTCPLTGAAVSDMKVQVPSRRLRAIAALYRRYTAWPPQTYIH